WNVSFQRLRRRVTRRPTVAAARPDDTGSWSACAGPIFLHDPHTQRPPSLVVRLQAARRQEKLRPAISGNSAQASRYAAGRGGEKIGGGGRTEKSANAGGP